MEFLSPSIVPFTAALYLMGFLVAAEVIGVLLGFMPSAALDGALPDFELDGDLDADLGANVGGPLEVDTVDLADGPSGLTRFLGWLSVGKVPVLVLIMAFLASFGTIGLVLASASLSTLGFGIPAVFSVPLAFVGSLYPTRWIGRVVGTILPKEHTEATSQNEFIGRTAIVTLGTAKRGLSAEAKLSDQHGQNHYIRVEPDNDNETFDQGNEVLIVSKVGPSYRVIQLPSEYLS